MIKGRPPRLHQIYQSYDPALFFLTICTLHRRKITNLDIVHDAFLKYARRGVVEHNVAVGRYVILPDHLHFFVRGDSNFVLKNWVGGLKRATSTALRAKTRDSALWQPGFFDHVLRSDESYASKWAYVRNNPVRHALVDSWEKWPYQGEIVLIDRA